MATRKLATVQYIHGISSIEGADHIECVHVLGWICVAKKGEFRVGQWCVYFEVDSFLPMEPTFEFLRKSCYRNDGFMGEGFRLRTQRFRGQVSQGLALPMSILPQGQTYTLGQDVTKLLGIRKWETEETVTANGTVIGDMPYGIPKTDELRVQAFPELIREFEGLPYYITTKMDGTSVTMYWKDRTFGVCGRNYEYADDGKCPFWAYAHRLGLPEKLRELEVGNIAIQGEFCGGGIQKNRLKLKTPEWYVFTIRNMDTSRRLPLQKMRLLCKDLGLSMVPIEEYGKDLPYKTVEDLLERAKGKYPSGMNKEGIVIRPMNPTYSVIAEGPLSMKVLNNDYLLKE